MAHVPKRLSREYQERLRQNPNLDLDQKTEDDICSKCDLPFRTWVRGRDGESGYYKVGSCPCKKRALKEAEGRRQYRRVF